MYDIVLKKIGFLFLMCMLTSCSIAQQPDYEKELNQAQAGALKKLDEKSISNLMEIALKQHDNEAGNFALAEVLVKDTKSAEKFILSVKKEDKEKWVNSRELFVAAASEVLYEQGEYFSKINKVQAQKIKELKDKFLKELEDSVKK